MAIPRLKSVSAGPLLVVQSMYLFYYMGGGGYNPFINLYYSRLGLNGVEIGSLVSLGVLVGVFAAFFWATLSDGLRIHNRVLSLALILSALAVFLISRADSYAALLPLVALSAFVANPIASFLDSSTLELIKLHNSSYGAVRLWGSVGWSISTWLVGLLVERSGIHWIFNAYILLMVVTFILSFALPKRTQVLRTSMWQGLRRLIRRDTVIFLVSIFMLSVSSSAAMSFFSIYLDHIGAKEGLIGLSWTFASMSEVPFMFYSGRLIKRFGARRLLGLAFVLYAVRWFLYSLIQAPVLVLVIQLLGGFSFALFLTTGVTYLNQRTPAGLTTTAQSLYNTVVFGLAGIAGSLLGGYLFDLVGMQALFQIAAVLALVAFGAFLLIPRSPGELGAALQPEG
ncbi:MAG: MFS transporter [Anaerolineae bacterium]